MADESTSLSGGCMCGAVRFELTEPLLGAVYCHCKRCQRRTGSGFSVSGLAQPGSFRLVSGSEAVRAHRPDDGWHKSFCGECGSQLFAQNPEHQEWIAVRLGAFDEDPGVRPAVHQYVAYAAPWDPLPDDGLPRFQERMGAE